MTHSVNRLHQRIRLGLGAAVLLGMMSACGSEQLDPTSDIPAGDALAGDTVTTGPVDSSAVPADSTLLPADSTFLPADSTLLPDTLTGLPDSTTPADSSGISPATSLVHTGIVFGNFNMQHKYITPVYNGSMQGLEPSWLMAELVAARARNGRMILKLVGGSDDRQKNADGTFSLAKWKALVDKFKTVNFSSYINDGTLMGVYLIDEPHNTSKWGGKIIPHATVEAMAKHTKMMWPNLPTFARARPTWLAQTSITYTYLDAGWFQYESYMGNPTTAVTKEVSAAKSKRLGLAVGLNFLNGGNGSSGIRGTASRWWKMSATEIRNIGTVLLNQTYACAFFNWTYIEGGSTYLARTDIKSAMTYLSTKAKAHVKISCRQ